MTWLSETGASSRIIVRRETPPQNDLPLITVVMPCLNRAQFVGAAVESVLTQSYTHFELIVMDGGSSDGTLDLLKRYADQDARVKVFTDPDDGLYDAVNKGLDLAKGELIGWLNTDDLYEPDTFQTVAEVFSRNRHVDAVCGDASVVADGSGHRIGPTLALFRSTSLSFETLPMSGVALNACFINCAVYQTLGRFRTDLKIASDRDYLIRMALHECRTIHIGKSVYRYRQHAGSLTLSHSHDADLRRHLEDAALCEGWLHRSPKTPGLQKYCRYHLAASTLAIMGVHLRGGDVLNSLGVLARAFRHCPKELITISGRIIRQKWATRSSQAAGRNKRSGDP